MLKMRTRVAVALSMSTVGVVFLARVTAGQQRGYDYDAAGNLKRIVDVGSDPMNCGAIGHVCPVENLCTAGQCVALTYIAQFDPITLPARMAGWPVQTQTIRVQNVGTATWTAGSATQPVALNFRVTQTYAARPVGLDLAIPSIVAPGGVLTFTVPLVCYHSGSYQVDFSMTLLGTPFAQPTTDSTTCAMNEFEAKREAVRCAAYYRQNLPCPRRVSPPHRPPRPKPPRPKPPRPGPR
jgi:hypothetical protein